jgi:hypothetical protein
MPLNSAQLGDLVNRARLKAPPVVSPPQTPPAVQAAQTATPVHRCVARPR